MTPRVITGFDQLSSSICCWLMAGQTFYAFYEKFGSWPKTGFLTHDFGHRNASKSIKGSIDTDFGLVFKKTLSQKNGSMDWGQVQVAKNSKTCLHCDVTSSKCKTENKNVFFQCQLEQLLNP